MADSYIGEIQAFPYNFALQGISSAWFPCLGQLLPIQAYAPLFSLIGTYYGGDGTQHFQLPNLNGHITNSQGTGPGIRQRDLGEVLGSNVVNLTTPEIAAHTHTLQLGARTTPGAQARPAANMAAIDPAFNGFVAPPSNTTLAMSAMTLTGQGQPHDNTQPTLAIVWCICYNGVFPQFDAA